MSTFPIDGGCTCREVRYRMTSRAAVRALLPLPLVPARDRRVVRAQRDDRGRPRRAAGKASPRSSYTPSNSGKGQKIVALPALPRSRCGATTPAPATRFASSASARSTSPTACRPTSTSSRRRSSRGSCCRRACPLPCRSFTTRQVLAGREPRALAGGNRRQLAARSSRQLLFSDGKPFGLRLAQFLGARFI